MVMDRVVDKGQGRTECVRTYVLYFGSRKVMPRGGLIILAEWSTYSSCTTTCLTAQGYYSMLHMSSPLQVVHSYGTGKIYATPTLTQYALRMPRSQSDGRSRLFAPKSSRSFRNRHQRLHRISHDLKRCAVTTPPRSLPDQDVRSYDAPDIGCRAEREAGAA